ncbi:uncharacterized protein LOC144639631, partial [Oculina patagonica]
QPYTKGRTLKDRNNTEVQTNPTIVKTRDDAATSSLIHNSTSIKLVPPVTKGSENSLKISHENSLKANKKDQRVYPAEPIGSHKDKSENTKVEKAASNSGEKNDREDGRDDPGNGVTHDSTNDVTQGPQSEVSGETGSGATRAPETSVTQIPGSDAAHSSSNVSSEPAINTTNHHSKHVSDQVPNSPQRVSDSPHKQSSQQKITSTKSTKKLSETVLDNAKSSSTLHTNDSKNVHFKKVNTPAKSKHVTQASRRTNKEERPQSNRAKEGHHIASHENSKSNDQPQPIKMQSNSSRTEPNPVNPTKEDIKPSKPQQVDVLTSRTPPTSLLTTSNDDNTYSIKQIVQ